MARVRNRSRNKSRKMNRSNRRVNRSKRANTKRRRNRSRKGGAYGSSTSQKKPKPPAGRPTNMSPNYARWLKEPSAASKRSQTSQPKPPSNSRNRPLSKTGKYSASSMKTRK